jgi:hypothetical protein
MTITLYNFVYKPRSELLIINHNKFVINDVVYSRKYGVTTRVNRVTRGHVIMM